MTDHWAHIRMLMLGQALFACTGLAGLMAWHIAGSDPFGFITAAMAAGCGYASALFEANAKGSKLFEFCSSWLVFGGILCAGFSTAAVFI